MNVLTPTEARIIEALALTIFPSGGAVSSGAREARVVAYLDAMLSEIEGAKAAQMRAMFALFEGEIAVWSADPKKRFTNATPEERRAYLATWDHSDWYPRRALFQALRSTLTLAYLADPGVRRQVGITDHPERDVPGHLAAMAAATEALLAAHAPSNCAGSDADAPVEDSQS